MFRVQGPTSGMVLCSAKALLRNVCFIRWKHPSYDIFAFLVACMANEMLPRLVGCAYRSFSGGPDTISNREIVSSLKLIFRPNHTTFRLRGRDRCCRWLDKF